MFCWSSNKQTATLLPVCVVGLKNLLIEIGETHLTFACAFHGETVRLSVGLNNQ